jgi:hypothetical protein
MDAKRLEDAHTLIQSMRTEGPVQPGQFTYDVLLFACQRDCIDGLIDGKLIITILTEVRPFAWLPNSLNALKNGPSRWTNPKLSNRTCTCEYALQSWRRKSAGVAKRSRERSPTRNPYRHDSQLVSSQKHRRNSVAAPPRSLTCATCAATPAPLP